MEYNVSNQAQQVEHDNACKVAWRICPCIVATLIRAKDVAECIKMSKNNSSPEVREARRQEDLATSELANELPASGVEGQVPLLPNSSIPEDLQRKRRIYLENAGISLVRKRLLALSPQAQFDKIHELDRATKDEAYLTIRKSKGAVQDSINALRAILQGMNREENEIKARETSIEKMLQERKDKAYKPKEVISGDATKARAQKKDTKTQVASLGIDISALLNGFNAELALKNIKASNEAKKDEEK